MTQASEGGPEEGERKEGCELLPWVYWWIRREGWEKKNSPPLSYRGPLFKLFSILLFLSGTLYLVSISSSHCFAHLLIKASAAYIFNGYILSQLNTRRVLSGRDRSCILFIFPRLPHIDRSP